MNESVNGPTASRSVPDTAVLQIINPREMISSSWVKYLPTLVRYVGLLVAAGGSKLSLDP